MKNYRLLSGWLFAILLMGIVSACQGPDREYTDYVSNDVAVVAKVNVWDILENAGCEISDGKLVMPPALQKFPTDPHFQTLLKLRGIDPRDVVIAYNKGAVGGILLMANILDKKEFVNFLTDDLQMTEKSSTGTLTIYEKNDVCIVVDGDLAIISSEDSEDAADELQAWRDAAAKAPLAAWKKDALSQGHTGVAVVNISSFESMFKEMPNVKAMTSFYDPQEIKNAVTVLNFELKDLKFEMRSCLYNAEGNKINPAIAQPDFDKSILAFTAPEDLLIGVTSLPEGQEWKSMLTDLFSEYLPNFGNTYASLYENLRGSLMISFGYSQISQLVDEAKFHLVLASGVEDGTAAATIKTWSEALQGLGCKVTEGQGTNKVEYMGMDFYLTSRGNDFIITTDPTLSTSGDPVIPASDFGNYTSQMIIKIPANKPNITMLPLPFSLTSDSYSTDDGGIWTLEMGDTKGKFLENLINLASMFS